MPDNALAAHIRQLGDVDCRPPDFSESLSGECLDKLFFTIDVVTELNNGATKGLLAEAIILLWKAKDLVEQFHTDQFGRDAGNIA